MPSYSIIILWFNPMVITSQPSQNGPELWVVALKKRAVIVEMMADYELKLLGNLFFVQTPVTVLNILGFF